MYTSILSTRVVNRSSDSAIAESSSAGFASRSACARWSLAFIGPYPVRSQFAFNSSLSHNAAMNSMLGA